MKLRLFLLEHFDGYFLWCYCESAEVCKSIAESVLKLVLDNDKDYYILSKENNIMSARRHVANQPRGYINSASIKFDEIGLDKISLYPFQPWQSREEKVNSLL